MKFLISHVSLNLALVHARDSAAKKWLADTAPADAQFFGNGLVIEQRFLQDFINVVCEAGGEFEY